MPAETDDRLVGPTVPIMLEPPTIKADHPPGVLDRTSLAEWRQGHLVGTVGEVREQAAAWAELGVETLILGVGAAGKEKIATTGRVKIKVDATGAPISIGDLLVTSDVPGTAMKSQPIDVGGAKIHRPGTVIGKALQALPGGRGEILVLLSMQ